MPRLAQGFSSTAPLAPSPNPALETLQRDVQPAQHFKPHLWSPLNQSYQRIGNRIKSHRSNRSQQTKPTVCPDQLLRLRLLDKLLAIVCQDSPQPTYRPHAQDLERPHVQDLGHPHVQDLQPRLLECVQKNATHQLFWNRLLKMSLNPRSTFRLWCALNTQSQIRCSNLCALA